MNKVVVGLGSNIEPEYNIDRARALLAKKYYVLAESEFKRTKPVGPIAQPDFVNGSVLLETETEYEPLKNQLNTLEKDLGRVASAERFGPRTIDMDIIVWNDKVVDEDFYNRSYLKESVLELIPDLDY